MDAVVRRDTTFTLRLDAFDGNTSWQAHSRRVGRWTLLVQQYDMCHSIRLRGHKPPNRESAHRSSLPSCIDLQNGDAGRRKAGRPHPGLPRDRLRERPAERDHPVRGVPVFRVYGSRTPRHWRHVDGSIFVVRIAVSLQTRSKGVTQFPQTRVIGRLQVIDFSGDSGFLHQRPRPVR
jgi:hypothetical protein